MKKAKEPTREKFGFVTELKIGRSHLKWHSRSLKFVFAMMSQLSRAALQKLTNGFAICKQTSKYQW